MKILMATDGSEQSITALRTASRLLRKGDNQFDLLCVAPEFLPPKSKRVTNDQKRAKMIETYRHKIELEARKMLIHAQSQMATEGIDAEIKTAIGSPAAVIVQMAASYDVTVIGAHDKYERSKPGLGPVATRIVASAPSAVLLGRDMAPEKNFRILAAVDGSLASEYALTQMAACLQTESTEITLIHVVETPWIHLGLDREWFDYPEMAIERTADQAGWDLELQSEARWAIEDARTQLERLGLSANTLIKDGDPALEILSESESGEYDLIVLGATSQTDFKHNLLGSVSTKVARDAPCSVFVAKFIE